ncbi:MAG: hypothetical protein AB1585_02770 [Thermodesulfobacteriota bacterium]
MGNKEFTKEISPDGNESLRIKIVAKKGNIGITIDFLKHLVDYPDLLNTISDGDELDFIDKDIPIKASGALKNKKISRYKIQHTFEPIKV